MRRPQLAQPHQESRRDLAAVFLLDICGAG
jgi:hypothetical protein